MIKFITTFGYVGLLKPAPGTWGSAAALVLGYLIYGFSGFWGLLVATILITALGFWAVPLAVADRPTEDPAEIVIDEVSGQWITLLPPVFMFWYMGVATWDLPWPVLVGSFAFFRLFDITKPWIIGKADRRHDAVGIMLDDIWAGVFAAIAVIALGIVWHAVFI